MWIKNKACFCMLLLCLSSAQATAKDIVKTRWDRIIDFVEASRYKEKGLGADEHGESYIQAILAKLSDPDIFNKVLTYTIKYNNPYYTENTEIRYLPNRVSLTKNEQGVLLSLCAYEQSKQRQQQNPLTWNVVKEEVGGVFKERDGSDRLYMNLFLDEDGDSIDEEYPSYQLFPLSQEKLLFIQKVAGGAHNENYLLWIIQKEMKNSAQFLLMDIPDFDDDKKSMIATNVLISHTPSYNKDTKQLTFESYPYYYTYELDSDRLTLKQKREQICGAVSCKTITIYPPK